MDDIRRICNSIVDLLKFTSNKKILSKVVVRTQNKTNWLTLPWAHNLFVMWVLDFLLWVILAQRPSSNSQTFVFFSLHSYGSIALGSKHPSEPFNNPLSSFSFLYIQPSVNGGIMMAFRVIAIGGPISLIVGGCLGGNGMW